MDTDLAPPSLFGKDELETFELGLPFSRSLIKTFVDHVRKAEAAAGGNGFVTLATLRAEFTSPAWHELNDENSILSKILLSSAFKNEKKGQTVGQIDQDALILYGLLLCQGNPADKAEQFYAVLQEGGKDQHEFITASDKDLDPVLEKLCALATTDAFTEFVKIAGLEPKYSEEDLKKLNADLIA